MPLAPNKTVGPVQSIQRSKNRKPKMALLFKGARTRLVKTLNPPTNLSLQFAMKGSYREENVISYIKDLQNLRFESQQKATILMLDNYSVHLSKSARALLIHKGYIPVYIGGGITGDIQVNDTHFHHPLKTAYREKEQRLMLEKLGMSPDKVPSPDRQEMMNLFRESTDEVLDRLDIGLVLKHNFLLKNLGGEEVRIRKS